MFQRLNFDAKILILKNTIKCEANFTFKKLYHRQRSWYLMYEYAVYFRICLVIDK